MSVVIQYNKRTKQCYAYDSISFWDPVKKQSRSKRTLKGRYNPVTKEITPTDERMKKAKERKAQAGLPPESKPPREPKSLIVNQIKSSGISTVMLEVARQTGLLSVLQSSFPDKWELMLTIAFYMLSDGSVMSYIDDWFEGTKIDLVDGINDVQCSRLFASISDEERQLFFKEWVKYRSELEYIAYDVTSISTYSQNIEIAEYGYNRDNEKLPQINYGMFYGVTSNLPVYYDAYSGSIPDKASLEYMMINAKDIGINDTTFVMDEGFVSKDNISFMLYNSYSFITMMPRSRKEYKSLIATISSNIEDGQNWIKDYKVYGVKQPISLDGNNLYAHAYFSNDRKAAETITHYEYIEKLGKELEKLSHMKSVADRYSAYYAVTGAGTNSFHYEVDYEKSNPRLKQMGYFALLTNNPKLTSAEVLQIYRGKDVIEKHFNQLKNDLDFHRLRTHHQTTTGGKIFIGFLALILRSHMLKVIKDNPETKKHTFDKVLVELKNIRTVILSNMKKAYTSVTKTQRDILSAFGIKEVIPQGGSLERKYRYM